MNELFSICSCQSEYVKFYAFKLATQKFVASIFIRPNCVGKINETKNINTVSTYAAGIPNANKFFENDWAFTAQHISD